MYTFISWAQISSVVNVNLKLKLYKNVFVKWNKAQIKLNINIKWKNFALEIQVEVLKLLKLQFFHFRISHLIQCVTCRFFVINCEMY